MEHSGSCQCQAVRFSVDGPIEMGITCNCSRCHRLGWTLTFVPAERFRLEAGEENLTEYRFNTKTIAHLFCKTCGIECFGRGKGHGGAETVAVNLLCLEDFAVSEVPTTSYDGKAA